ncbi:CRISPR-associated protein Cas2 [Austwickia chelonae]|uniref:Putative CRISPR-associated protein n=1 Tax=Austwickia chelonae NBRC 105200 TaxID=1184607 RepID=K6VRM8_9MICO|nr:type I-E CRISPR-associated endoribonuclease Cas2e [Austwickia chelonae]GAB79419.1 putative CRISPR-associated protein [Austwickia chelonae NBRC 105200]SEW36950.1 CRISPR-associated protein Cas2 [Austwickia chelonae]
MVVIVLTACPVGLRGYLTRWLLEVSAGVFVGKVNARVREELWDRVLEMVKDGRAIMVFGTNSEQGLDFRVYRHDWEVVDLDGVRVMLRPAAPSEEVSRSGLRPGWSKASHRRRAAKRS